MYSAILELLGSTVLFLQMLSLKRNLLPSATCFWHTPGAMHHISAKYRWLLQMCSPVMVDGHVIQVHLSLEVQLPGAAFHFLWVGLHGKLYSAGDFRPDGLSLLLNYVFVSTAANSHLQITCVAFNCEAYDKSLNKEVTVLQKLHYSISAINNVSILK